MELPTLREQRRIAATLDQSALVRRQGELASRRYSQLSEAVFRDRFGGLAADTHVVDVASATGSAIRTGPFGSQLLHEEFVDEGVAVLGIDNVVTNEFRWAKRRFVTAEKYRKLQRYTVSSGDVLITIMGTCGRCAVVPDDIPLSINTKHLCAITVDRQKCLPEFLRACFLWHPESRRYLEARAKGAIMSGLNMGVITEMPMPLAPLAEQRRFVAQSEAIELQGARAQASVRALGGLLASLQARAFSGRL